MNWNAHPCEAIPTTLFSVLFSLCYYTLPMMFCGCGRIWNRGKSAVTGAVAIFRVFTYHSTWGRVFLCDHHHLHLHLFSSLKPSISINAILRVYKRSRDLPWILFAFQTKSFTLDYRRVTDPPQSGNCSPSNLLSCLYHPLLDSRITEASME